MSDGKIYITISDKRGGEGKPAEPMEGGASDKKENTFSSWAKHQFLSMVKQQAIGNLNYAISNIGNFTGDYNAQRSATFAMQLANEATSFGLSVLAGAKMGGLPGAVVGAVLYAGNKTIQTAQQYALIQLKQRQTDYSIDQIRMRAGLNPYLDGSRGTEN